MWEKTTDKKKIVSFAFPAVPDGLEKYHCISNRIIIFPSPGPMALSLL
jgi:hypothetical protein